MSGAVGPVRHGDHMRVDCSATNAAEGQEHRCCLQPGHHGNHVCHACRHSWANTWLVLVDAS